MNSLLSDPIFTVNLDIRLSLPGVLAALARNEVKSFSALRKHQQHAWYAFLAQLAVLALEDEAIPTSAVIWKDRLLKLAPEEAWSLISPIDKPAFLQPPVNDTENWKAEQYPDDMDMILSNKEHSQKSSKIIYATEEHWIYALVTLQTMQGQLGFGNYGISRMNKGLASRPCVTIRDSHSLDWNAEWRRDANLMRQNIQNKNGIKLLWLAPWDGLKSSRIPLDDCCRFFIEICRLIRLQSINDKIVCLRQSTEGQRLSVPQGGAVVCTDDPWTPIVKGKPIAIHSLSYKKMVDIIFGDNGNWQRSLCQQATGKVIHASTFVRGLGLTNGLVSRNVDVPVNYLEFAENARERIKDIEKVYKKVLSSCIRRASGEIDPILSKSFFAAIEKDFFPYLFSDRDLVPVSLQAASNVLDTAIALYASNPKYVRQKFANLAEKLFPGKWTPKLIEVSKSVHQTDDLAEMAVYDAMEKLTKMRKDDLVFLQRFDPELLDQSKWQRILSFLPSAKKKSKEWATILWCLSHTKSISDVPLGTTLKRAGVSFNRLSHLLDSKGEHFLRNVRIVFSQSNEFNVELAELILTPTFQHKLRIQEDYEMESQ